MNLQKFYVILIIGVISLSSCSANKDKSFIGNENPESKENVKNTFQPLNVDEKWNDNPFTFFKGQGLLLAVGDSVSNNAMTIGWGALGNVWGKIGSNTVTVYVAEARYTYEFMEKYDYFTVMAFDRDDARILEYMGTHSGREEDKAAHLGLHTRFTEYGTPYYEEATLVLECRTIYKAPFLTGGMCEDAQKFYENFDAGIHHIYIGNIVGAWIKE